MKKGWLAAIWLPLQNWVKELQNYNRDFNHLMDGIRNNSDGVADQARELVGSKQHSRYSSQRILVEAVRQSKINNFIEIYEAIGESPNFTIVDNVGVAAAAGVAVPITNRTALIDFAIEQEREDIAVFLATQHDFKFSRSGKTESLEEADGTYTDLHPLPIHAATSAGMDELLEELNELRDRAPYIAPLPRKAGFRFIA